MLRFTQGWRVTEISGLLLKRLAIIIIDLSLITCIRIQGVSKIQLFYLTGKLDTA